MSGRRPRYVQALSENDLKAALAMFRQSKCRFLHFSFHGTSDSIALGDGRCDHQSFTNHADVESCFNNLLYVCAIVNMSILSSFSEDAESIGYVDITNVIKPNGA